MLIFNAKTINIVKIPKANPKSPMRFTINALIAAAFAVGFLYQNQLINKRRVNTLPAKEQLQEIICCNKHQHSKRE